MSLICHNCGQEMGPSDSFPGREGTMVFPNVLSFIWVVEAPKSKWSINYVQPKINLSLCFACIAGKVHQKRQNVLGAVYSAYTAEINYRRNEEFEKDKMLSGEELGRGIQLFKEWKAKFGAIPNCECIFCGTKLPDDKNPFFTVRVIDKVYSEGHLSWFNTNYSWSNIEGGMTIFNMCFKCLRDEFPRLFEDFSYILRGVTKPNPKNVVKNEIFLTQDFAEALRKEVGDEKAKELIDALSQKAEITLVAKVSVVVDPEKTKLN